MPATFEAEITPVIDVVVWPDLFRDAQQGGPKRTLPVELRCQRRV